MLLHWHIVLLNLSISPSTIGFKMLSLEVFVTISCQPCNPKIKIFSVANSHGKIRVWWMLCGIIIFAFWFVFRFYLHKSTYLKHSLVHSTALVFSVLSCVLVLVLLPMQVSGFDITSKNSPIMVRFRSGWISTQYEK